MRKTLPGESKSTFFLKENIKIDRKAIRQIKLITGIIH